MCMFSGQIEHVSATRIFVRGLDDGRQVLAYSMELAAAHDVAMVLPLPVPPDGREDAVEFIDLSKYPRLFDDLKNAFPVVELRAQAFSLEAEDSLEMALPLEVHEVGSYEASYVPRQRDFARLDPRFRLSPDVLAALPGYADWGFAVFQLRATAAPSHVHPMAFRFPRREPDALFFPTVHVHDNRVPDIARFDHTLYAQLSPLMAAVSDWTPSTAPLGTFVRDRFAGDLIDPDALGAAQEIEGDAPNRDVWLRAPAGVSVADLSGSGATYRYRVCATHYNRSAAHFPHWPTTARKLPQLCSGIRRELAALCADRARAWQLGPLSPALSAHFMNGTQLWRGTSYMDGSPQVGSGPGRIVFRPYTHLVETQDIELGFAALPSPEEAIEIHSALCAMLDRAVA